jgi:diguanylate cyclase (GGDEF)-like protein
VQVRRISFGEADKASPHRPLLGFAVLAAVAVAAHPQGTDWGYVVLAGLVFAGGAAVVALRPAREDSSFLPLVPALSAILAIAMLRQSQGGSTSGYSPLAILAVVWVAIVLDRRAVRLVTACSALMFAVPLLFVGAPMYPSSGWRGAVLWTVTAYIVGAVVNAAFGEQRRQAADAHLHAQEMEEMQRAFAAIARVARDVSLGTDARQLVCAVALTSTQATLSTVVEPRGSGFEITGSAGVPIAAGELRSIQPGASIAAFEEGRRIFIADVAKQAGVSPQIVRATGIVSVLYEPILRDGQAVGVLAIAWDAPRGKLDAKTAAIAQFLAAEAGAAIERADLLTRLEGQARSDPLTLLPNRRAWDEALALATRGDDRVCVAMVDIDHFKQFNDDHGHAAGDRLLRACAVAWRGHLRPGDTIARVGGEEFAVLLPDCAIEHAARVLERLRDATPHGATASVGVAERLPGESPGDVLARADAALYEAKDSGRDRLRAAA